MAQLGLFSWFKAAWFLAVLPASLFGILWLSKLVFWARHPLGEFLALVTGFSVLVLTAGHSMKATIRMHLWA